MGNQDIMKTAGRGKRRHSLAAKTVHSTLLSCMLLGAVALIIGLGLYGSALVQRSISRAFETAGKAAISAEKGADSIGLSKEIMAVYRSLTPEQRAKTGTEDYRRFFSSLDAVSQKGGPYDTLIAAQALARGYTDLYHVNTDTDEFVEYYTDDNSGELTEVRRGSDFFERCAQEARVFVHPEDQEGFFSTMSRDRLTEALDGNGTLELTYRQIKDGTPSYVKMRVSRMEDDKRFIVIAVADFDEQMRQRTLVDIYSAVSPDLVIVDCIKGQGGFQNNKASCVMAGSDVVALDTVLCAMADLPLAANEGLMLASQYGMGVSNPAEITIVGDDLREIMADSPMGEAPAHKLH